MNHQRTFRFWRSAEQCLLGIVILALLTFVCFRFQVNPTTVALLYLIVIVLRGQEGMASLATGTGGAAFLLDKPEDLKAVFRQIAAELQAQYLLGYYSTDERRDGQFRRIAVRVPGRSDLRIRARQDYYATKG